MQKGHIVDQVERLRAKPEHIRMRIAMATTFGMTGLVVLIWGTTTLVSGKLAIDPYGNATPSSTNSAVTGASNTQIAGAAGAFGTSKNAPVLSPVDVATTTPAAAQTTDTQDMTGGAQTIIQF